LRRLLVTASVVPSSPILVTLMKEALRSSETSVLTRATQRNIPEDTILEIEYTPLLVVRKRQMSLFRFHPILSTIFEFMKRIQTASVV
jgi:hypothetical protein